VLRGIFWSKREEVTIGRDNYTQRGFAVCTLPQTRMGGPIRTMRWAGHVAKWEEGNIYKDFMRNSD